MRWRRIFQFIGLFMLVASGAAAQKTIELVEVKPTPFFPRVESGQPLRQIAQLALKNSGNPAAASVRVTMQGQAAYTENLGEVPAGSSQRAIRLPDISQSTELTLELFRAGESEPADRRTLTWQPQRKWKIYHVAYSHQDLGYADYYHMMRRDVREWGTDLALEYCRQTDDWDADSQYRWTIETAEPMTKYIQGRSKAVVEELARRIREGRIELGAIHNSVNTEGMSYEAMARLFYTPNRYIVDLLGIEPRPTALLDDVVGLSRSLPLFTKEADVPYFFHGRNGLQDQLQPASAEPVYHWLAPDGDRGHMTLYRTQHYHLAPGEFGGGLQTLTSGDVEKLVARYAARPEWVYDAILAVDCWDFSLPELRKTFALRDWNAGFAYPRVISATMSMFFIDMASQAQPAKVFVFDKDAPNTWIDQDYTDVEAVGNARILGYELPTVEKLSTLAMVLGGKGYPWVDIWQAYHRLLMYHEHTDAAYAEGPIYAPPTLKDKTAANALYYEAEVEMHRRLPQEGRDFAARAREDSLGRLDSLIPTGPGKTVIVYNPLNWERTDVVRLETAGLPEKFHLLDNATRRPVPSQKFPDGTAAFIAEHVLSLGYKTFLVVPGEARVKTNTAVRATPTTLENQFYKVTFDAKSGGITSIFDKQLKTELVDQQASYRFNEYLYQHVAGDKPEWERVESAELASAAGPVAAVMTATIKAPGTNGIRQQVVLYQDLRQIDFVANIAKASCGRTLADYKAEDPARVNNHKEAVFYALPFRVPDFQIHHELAGAVVEPIADQSVGSSTDYYGIQHFSDLANAQYGVTLATVEGGLVEYGKPRPSQTWIGESILEKPAQSHVYLYLMNNWFGTNIRIDQPGPKTFHWSVRSHSGDWKQGQAYTFGWTVSHPLMAQVVEGERSGKLSAASQSFAQVDKPNVILSDMKLAEANGAGLILRFHELAGSETEVTATLAFLDKIQQANETSLVEVDRPVPVKFSDNRITFTLPGHGLKTIRVRMAAAAPGVENLTAHATSDMTVSLTWQPAGAADAVSHYDVYRDTSADFKPGLRYLVGRPPEASYVDQPKLNYGGWIDNRLDPATTYFYKVAAVDRWNNEGPASSAVPVTTMKPSEKAAAPSRVEGLYVVNVSPVSPHNYIALWFYTNAEADVTRYRIHRGTTPAFTPDATNLLTELDATATFTHTTPHGFGTATRQLREYNRILYVDQDVRPDTTYYYQVCAVNDPGKVGQCSTENSARTKP